MLFRVTANAAGIPFVSTKGPLLLMHGAFSDSVDWIKCQDVTLPPVAVQLAEEGYDVWIASGRGRQFSRTHATLDPDNPADAAAYWYYSYEQIGLDEIPALTDKIVQSRPGQCEKVTLVAHNSAVNSALVAASRIKDLSDTVGKIVGLGPCLQFNIETHFLSERDIASADAVQNFINSLGIVYLFGPNHDELI